MYMTYTKKAAVDATKAAFGASHREADFRNIYVSIEYPIDKASYPGIWVNFDPIGALNPVAHGYYELDGSNRKVFRWSFAGVIEWTIVAMSSLERDRLFDAVVGMIAFGHDGGNYGDFRSAISNHPLIGLTPNYDEIDQRAFGASPGTPWQTDEVLYEGTISVDAIGEFVSAEGLGEPLIPTSSITLVQWVEDFEDEPSIG